MYLPSPEIDAKKKEIEAKIEKLTQELPGDTFQSTLPLPQTEINARGGVSPTVTCP